MMLKCSFGAAVRAALLIGAAAWMAASAQPLPQAEELPIFIAAQTDKDGKPMPVAANAQRILDRIGEEAGLKLVIKQYPWRRAQAAAEQGLGLIYGLGRNEERSAKFIFTTPLYVVNQYLVVQDQRVFEYNGLADLAGKTVSVTPGAHYFDEFERQRNKVFRVEENAESILARFNMLALGRVDAVLLDSHRAPAQFEARMNCLYGKVGKWHVLPKPMGTEPLMIAAQKNARYADIVQRLNAAIDKLNAEGAIRQVLDRASTTACPGA
ncbi:MAG: substrate-binding periplasmic protein [Telluria sp.]